MYPCDLHTHTNRSDGLATPRELIDHAAALGLKALAITDHDITPPPVVELPDGSTQDTAAYARSKGLEYVPGYEFSCDTHVDDVHICGYRLDWSSPDVKAEVDAAKRSKSDAYRQLCEVLTAHGMPVDWDKDLLNFIGPDGVPRRRDPDEVQRKHIFEVMAAKGYVPSWSDGKIMVQGDPTLNVQRRKIGPLAAIELIHACGGIAVLAHPYLIEPKCMSRDAYIERLFAAGLDGIEASYSYDKTTYKGKSTPEQIEAEIRVKYRGEAKFFSGGSDYHADERKKDAKKVRSLGERGVSLEDFKTIFG